MRASLTNRGHVRAVLVAFALFLAYQSLAEVVTTALLLATGLLLAGALSALVEALHRRKAEDRLRRSDLSSRRGSPRWGRLLYPALAEQAAQLATALPGALSQLVERARRVADDLGLNIGGEGGGDVSPSTLASAGRKVLGGALGLFGGLASFFAGLIVLLLVPLYLAAMPEPVVGWIVRLFPPEKGEGVRGLLSEARMSLLGWLGGNSSR